MRILFVILSIGLTQTAVAFGWQDLWETKDQQAKIMMDKGDYAKAKDTFQREDWQAASAYRAGDYQQAETLYQSFKTEDAYYNQGNALAQMGQYQKALDAYDKTLTINPNHQDALHNRRMVEDLLKKQDQNKQDQDKKDQDKKDQDKKDQDKKDQDKKDQDKKDQDKKDQDKKDQDKKDQDKKDQDKQNPASETPSQAQRENQQAKDQWLRLIPDDPGGLLREKFMRDHLRRHNVVGQ